MDQGDTTVQASVSESAKNCDNFTNEVKLSSVKKLRKVVDDACHSGLREIIANHTFVGCANREFALLQNATKLFVVNIPELTRHFFYQKMLTGMTWPGARVYSCTQTNHSANDSAERFGK